MVTEKCDNTLQSCHWCGESVQGIQHWTLVGPYDRYAVYCGRYKGCRIERAYQARSGSRSVRRARRESREYGW